MGEDLQARLFEVFERLSAADRDAVVAFAEFLQARSGGTPLSPAESSLPAPAPVLAEPLAIERPAEERVVAAVKRLSRTYPMLDRKQMLGVTSDLVTQHVLQGRDAVEVIDDLEQAFLDEYLKLKDR